MITGFNTDIEFNGVVYHVQTEDKGVDTPLILSLVYVGGAILASKRSPYQDLIDEGFDPLVLAERLQRQHKLICAAVKSGRIEDLKRLSSQDTDAPTMTTTPAPGPVAAKAVSKSRDAAPSVAETAAPPVRPAEVHPVEDEYDILALEDVPLEVMPPLIQPRTPTPASSPPSAKSPAEPVRPIRKQEEEFIQVEAEGALHLSLMEERDFHAGEVVTIRIRVSRGAGEGRVVASSVPVTVKILGTEFRPLILTTRSDKDGVATIHAWLPRFTKGRAAVLVRATLDGFSAELRRVIHQP